MEPSYPAGVVLHIPHSSTRIPSEVRDQFVLEEDELQKELVKMTDHRTLALFAGPDPQVPVVAAPVSRVVVDVERFEQDDLEPMAAVGMGVIYCKASDGSPLRRELLEAERESLISTYYQPHHQQLIKATDAALLAYGRCLILDGHSFPSSPLPYELDQSLDRADICIGTDDFHSPDPIREAFEMAFSHAGFTVAINRPFAGAIVPFQHYRQDRRVMSVMVEINRALYLREPSAVPRESFEELGARIRHACCEATRRVMSERPPIF